MYQRFYTLPPREIYHPYLLVNIKNIKELEKREYEHSIVDIGIYDLLKGPHQHSEEKLKQWKQLKVSGWKVVPDCPSLLYEFDVNISFSNTEYSKELMTEYYDPNDETHMPVIQATIIKGSDDYQGSIRNYVDWFKRNYDTPKVLGIGSVCKSGNKQMTIWTCRFIRWFFPNTWLHAFGLKLHHFREVRGVIDSYDSMAWTFPRKSGLPSCKNKKMRIEYFHDYLKAIS